MSFSQVPWFLLCGGLTVIGLIGSWFALRRRGVRSALRGVAWSLLPVALYLVGILQVLWRFGVAIGDFFSGLAFSPKVWSGVALAGLALVLFVVTGGLRGRERRKRARGKQEPEPAPSALPAPRPATTAAAGRPAAALPRRKSKAAPEDDEFGEVAAILKRRGIS